VICKFCGFDFSTDPDSGLIVVRCEEHDSPICLNCCCCQAVEPVLRILAPLREVQRWRDAT